MTWSPVAAVTALSASLLCPLSAMAQCSDFNDGTVQGWTTQAATIELSSGGLDGTDYLRCGDLPSGPVSAILAPAAFLGDLSSKDSICLDFIVHNDGLVDSSASLTRIFIMGDGPPGTGVQARFIVNTPIVEGDGWHTYTALLTPGATPPIGADGTWSITPLGASWNDLLANVQSIWFQGDIAGSPTQLEDFGLDNFCFFTCDEPTAVENSSWGRIKALYERQ